MAVWIGDGECDVENNNEACEFDGGDCHWSNAYPAGKAKLNQLVRTKFQSIEKNINIVKILATWVDDIFNVA